MPEHHAVDVHQHLWPEQLIDRLRARSRTPYLRGWTLHTRGEAPYDVDPAHHDVEKRIAADENDGIGLACVSLSAPLGIENLVRPEASALLDAWHAGAAELPAHFTAWASVPMVDPDLDRLAAQLDSGFAGVQIPATDLLSPAAWERAGAVLRVAEQAGRPVLVHPGPEFRRALTGQLPDWWASVVGYATQMQAAWWAWHAIFGRDQFPSLRVVFAAAAGLAPVHHERHVARGGQSRPVDPDVFVDTSSYGVQGLDALVRALGIDALVLGSDRPYGTPVHGLFGDAGTQAIRVSNPRTLLGIDAHAPKRRKERPAWSRAS